MSDEGWDPWSDPGFVEYAEHFLSDALPKIDDSAATFSLLPSNGVGDVKFWTELGASIMLGKPIVAIVMPGLLIPPKLLEVVDYVVEGNIETEESREELALQLQRILKEIVQEEES